VEGTGVERRGREANGMETGNERKMERRRKMDPSLRKSVDVCRCVSHMPGVDKEIKKYA